MATQYDIVRLDTVESTQDRAKQMLESTGEPVLVVAQRQTLGRGRQGREWMQPDRGLFASYAFVSDWRDDVVTLVPLIAAVAMREALIEITGVEVGLRWPNDLMGNEGKIGGILVEANPVQANPAQANARNIVAGCGVNLWWRAPVAGAAAVSDDDPGTGLAGTLAESWAERFENYLVSGGSSWPRTAYETASVTLGRRVHWGSESGVAVAIADDGALVVDQDGEHVSIHAGEVHTHDGR